MRVRLRVLCVMLTTLAFLSPAPARAATPRDPMQRLFLDPGNFPLIPSLGSTFGWALSTGLWEGMKGVAGTAAIGAPVTIGMQLLAQNAMGLEVDVTKAVWSGLGATLLPLALAGMTGPAAPLVYFGVSMAGSYIAQYLLDRYRDRRAARAAAGPADRLAAAPGGLSLLGVAGTSTTR